MNTDKIYAESIANEYSVKNDSKVVALKKLDKKVKDFPLIVSMVIGVISDSNEGLQNELHLNIMDFYLVLL